MAHEFLCLSRRQPQKRQLWLVLKWPEKAATIATVEQLLILQLEWREHLHQWLLPSLRLPLSFEALLKGEATAVLVQRLQHLVMKVCGICYFESLCSLQNAAPQSRSPEALLISFHLDVHKETDAIHVAFVVYPVWQGDVCQEHASGRCSMMCLAPKSKFHTWVRGQHDVQAEDLVVGVLPPLNRDAAIIVAGHSVVRAIITMPGYHGIWKYLAEPRPANTESNRPQ